MKKVFVLKIVLLLSLIIPAVGIADEDKIRSSYQNLIAAFNAGDGKNACRYVANDVFGFYGEARKLALYYKADDIEKETPMKIVLILQLRYMLSKKEMEKMSNGKDVFAWGVNTGLVKKDIISTFSLDKIQSQGKEAVASVLKNGKPAEGVRFKFKKDGDIWKLDLLSLLSAPDMIIEQSRKEAGLSRIDFALRVMEESYGDLLPPNIINGPIK